jgi:hypothetical protein
MLKTQLMHWMVVKFETLEFGLNSQKLIAEEEDLIDIMIPKQNVSTVTDMVIGLVLVPRKETKENVTIAVNLDIKQENALRKEEEVMIEDLEVEAEVEAEIEIEINVVEVEVEVAEVEAEAEVGAQVGVHFEMEMLNLGKEEAEVGVKVHVREVIANSHVYLLHSSCIINFAMFSRLETLSFSFFSLFYFPLCSFYILILVFHSCFHFAFNGEE